MPFPHLFGDRPEHINQILRDRGFQYLRQVASVSGVNRGEVSSLLNGHHSPLNDDGFWSESAKKIADAVGSEPSELWPDEAESVRLLEQSVLIDWVSEYYDSEQSDDPENLSSKKKDYDQITSYVDRLSPVHRTVVISWMDDMTFEDIGKAIDLSRGRSAIIFQEALGLIRRMQASPNCEHLTYDPTAPIKRDILRSDPIKVQFLRYFETNRHLFDSYSRSRTVESTLQNCRLLGIHEPLFNAVWNWLNGAVAPYCSQWEASFLLAYQENVSTGVQQVSPLYPDTLNFIQELINMRRSH